MCPQCFDDFFLSGGSSRIMFCCCAHYFCCFCAFVCILCAFVTSLCAHGIAVVCSTLFVLHFCVRPGSLAFHWEVLCCKVLPDFRLWRRPSIGKCQSKGHVARTFVFGCSVLAGWLHGPFTKTSLGRCVWSLGRV